MGLFWDLLQQCELSKHEARADTIEGRLARVESELYQTQRQLRDLLAVLETEFGKDIDGDGKVGG